LMKIFYLFKFVFGPVTFFFFFRFCDVARWLSFNSRFTTFGYSQNIKK
jgi:hypothetical protein